MSTGGSKKAIAAAFLANLGIALAKFVAFLFTSSSSMLAESVHSLADTGNQGLLMLGGKRAQREATPLHPFGYGRERYFWAFVVAIILFTLGALFAIYEGIEKVAHAHEHELESPGWAIGTLLVAIGLEAFSFRTAMREAEHVRGGSSIRQFIKHARAPELPVVILEDLGALVGLGLALVAVGLSIVTGNPVWDGVGTLCIGTLLFAIALILATEMKSLLIGESATPDVEAKIQDAIEGSNHTKSLIHLRTEHLGPEELLVVAKVEFPEDMRMRDLAAAVDSVEVDIRTAVPEARLLFIEPDIRRDRPALGQGQERPV